ncbi:DNA gyrase subunit A [Candidatus Fermentibacterales bacterium]|nr:DNA gyrase subunit A [Candidatus Fermentibacterales bacterium]
MVEEEEGTRETSPAVASRLLTIDLEDEMRRSYLDYSMSVIVSRALPDVRDGLKPVHRRILYSMFEQNLTHSRPFKKSAAVVGDVLGKYHPHSDSAVYDALVRMAQLFSMRHPLVEGQGNFGSVEGDPPAAYRYTEARMSRCGGALLRDIEAETVDFMPNFDGRLSEPVVLPSLLPNLLLNGTSGIAVGMATNIPPHSLRELVSACCLLIERPEITDEELLEVVRGPDFPTGGMILGRAGIRDAYLTGKGAITVCGRTRMEKTPKGRDAIVITEIPYQVNLSSLISAIADLVKQKKVPDIADLRNESDREGMRIVVELKKDCVPEIVLNQLYKHTALKATFNANMLALVDNQPRVLTLREMLGYFVEHRHEVVTRRSRFELGKAEERAHILEGLRIALGAIDEVVETIRASRDTDEARAGLMSLLGLSEAQAQAILDMRLRRLTALEREELDAEYDDLVERIERLRELLASREERMKLVARELRDGAEEFGEERRTSLSDTEPETLGMEDLIADDEMVITVSRAGYTKRLPVDTYRLQRRGGRGITGASTREEDVLDQVFVATNHSYILCFTNYGRCYWLKVYKIPEAGRTSKGKAIVNLLNLGEGELPVASVCLRDFEGDRFVITAGSDGMVKKSPLIDYSRPRRAGIVALRLRDNSRLIGAGITDGNSEIVLATRKGYANRFGERDVRSMGRQALGVRGIRLREDDRVVSMVVVREGTSLLTITRNGYGQRAAVDDYRLTRRGSMGVINIRNVERNGQVVQVMEVSDEDEAILVSARGMIIRVPVAGIRATRRMTQGVRLMVLPEDDEVVDAARLVAEELEDPEEQTGAPDGDGSEEPDDD